MCSNWFVVRVAVGVGMVVLSRLSSGMRQLMGFSKVVLACGPWSSELIPELRPFLKTQVIPVTCVAPPPPRPSLPPRDLPRMGFYGYYGFGAAMRSQNLPKN